MAGRGQIPNPALRQYDRVPLCMGVYVVDAGNGVVKVGKANVLRARLRELHSYLVRSGYAPQGFESFPITGGRLNAEFAAETRCLRALERVGTPLPRRREFFTGISFVTAADIVRRTLNEHA